MADPGTTKATNSVLALKGITKTMRPREALTPVGMCILRYRRGFQVHGIWFVITFNN